MSEPQKVCPICLGSGWEDCEATWCTDPDHGSYCQCPIGGELAREDWERSHPGVEWKVS